jgi:ATP-binding cassette subfamily B (MDR/TAP) protein 1
MKKDQPKMETTMSETNHSMNKTNHSTAGSDEDKKKKKKVEKNMASFFDTMAFVFDCGPRVQFLFFLGALGGVLNGLVYPAIAYLFSNAFADIGGASLNGLTQVKELAFTFMIVGVYALVNGTMQTWCFEIVAYHGSQNFRLLWFKALLRQDPAYFDVNDIAGVAAQVGPNSTKFRRGVGRKFGEGIQVSQSSDELNVDWISCLSFIVLL